MSKVRPFSSSIDDKVVPFGATPLLLILSLSSVCFAFHRISDPILPPLDNLSLAFSFSISSNLTPSSAIWKEFNCLRFRCIVIINSFSYIGSENSFISILGSIPNSLQALYRWCPSRITPCLFRIIGTILPLLSLIDFFTVLRIFLMLMVKLVVYIHS